jgi:hypothetical protein
MKLLTKEILSKLPKLYATEGVALADKVLIVKFFHPYSVMTWYGAEYNPDERTFFGYVCGLGPGCDEWGYFSMDELESVKHMGLGIERDLHFTPTTFKQLFPKEV